MVSCVGVGIEQKDTKIIVWIGFDLFGFHIFVVRRRTILVLLLLDGLGSRVSGRAAGQYCRTIWFEGLRASASSVASARALQPNGLTLA